MKKLLLLTTILVTSILSFGQSIEEFSVKFSGFVNSTAIFDSRKIVGAREGHFLFYPKEKVLNSEGKDINDVSNFNMAVIMTRFGAKINTPTFLSSKPSVFVETEFMGNSDNDVNGLRLRHALLTLDWDNTSLAIGQTWNPMFIPETFPQEIGSNAGAPMHPFARNPQIRLTQTLGKIKLIAAITSQRDFTSTGPIGSSNEYLKNAVIPDIHLHFQYKGDKEFFGIGGQYKNLRPATESANGIINKNTVPGYSVQGYAKITFNKLVVSGLALYGANLTDVSMLGGYAVKSSNPVTKIEDYTPIKVYAFWSDISYGSDLKLGVFLGYTKNLGTTEENTGKYYARGANIESVYRIAPRIEYQENKIKLSFETEYTNAAYGLPDSFGKFNNATGVNNIRIQSSIFYFF